MPWPANSSLTFTPNSSATSRYARDQLAGDEPGDRPVERPPRDQQRQRPGQSTNGSCSHAQVPQRAERDVRQPVEHAEDPVPGVPFAAGARRLRRRTPRRAASRSSITTSGMLNSRCSVAPVRCVAAAGHRQHQQRVQDAEQRGEARVAQRQPARRRPSRSRRERGLVG